MNEMKCFQSKFYVMHLRPSPHEMNMSTTVHARVHDVHDSASANRTLEQDKETWGNCCCHECAHKLSLTGSM